MLEGSTLVFDPASPPPVYVPRVSPHLDPNATYAFLAFATFTLRLRTEEKLCFITQIYGCTASLSTIMYNAN